LYDIKVFKEYLDACDEKRGIEDITPVELQEMIKKFVLAVRKKNGEEYEPSSLRAFIQSIDQMWFKCSPLGVNSLRTILKNMIRDSGLETD